MNFHHIALRAIDKKKINGMGRREINYDFFVWDLSPYDVFRWPPSEPPSHCIGTYALLSEYKSIFYYYYYNSDQWETRSVGHKIFYSLNIFLYINRIGVSRIHFKWHFSKKITGPLTATHNDLTYSS